MMRCIFLCVERALIFCVILFYVWNALWYFVLYFSTCGTRSGILSYIFPHVEHALVFCVIFFRVWNPLWYSVLYFSACGTWSGFFVLYFMRVERSLVFCFKIFRVWNVIWYFLSYIFLLLSLFCVALKIPCFPLIVYFPLVWNYTFYVLWYCGIPGYIFACGTRSGLWN